MRYSHVVGICFVIAALVAPEFARATDTHPAPPPAAPRIGLFHDGTSFYPVSVDPVNSKPLVADGVTPYFFSYKGREIGVRDKSEEAIFTTSPRKYLDALDAAIRAEQEKDYPLTSCPITNKDLHVMGGPLEFIVNNYLVKTCCGGCKVTVTKDPSKVIPQLEAFWSAPDPAKGATATNPDNLVPGTVTPK